MTEQTECRWKWGQPDRPGLWWHKLTDEFKAFVSVIRYPDSASEKWWAYIGPIPPEPLSPKKKITQTLWMVPQTWYVGGIEARNLHSANWFGPDDTIPPGAIETVQKREVEL